MLNPPRRDACLDRLHQAFPVLGRLLVQGNFFVGWRPEMLTMKTLPRFFAGSDETRQLVHPAIFRSAVEHGVIDAGFARLMPGHRSKMDAPIGCKARIAGGFSHWTPSLHIPLRGRSAPPRQTGRRINAQTIGSRKTLLAGNGLFPSRRPTLDSNLLRLPRRRAKCGERPSALNASLPSRSWRASPGQRRCSSSAAQAARSRPPARQSRRGS